MTTLPISTRFGWHGIEIDVPAAWELHTYNGGFDAGYAGLDDGFDLRLHVRWNRRTRRRAHLESTLRRYERKLTRARKGGVKFQTLGPEFLPKRMRQTKDIAPFSWEGTHAAFGLAWYCRECRTVLFLEVLFPSGEADRQAARKLFASTTDHREDGQRLWSVYGFAFRAPDTYNLDQPDLAPGRLQFLLHAPKRRWLKVERWAMASHWVRKTPLERWPREMMALARIDPREPFEQHAVAIRGHEGCRFVRGAARRRLRRHECIEGIVWVCPEDDKVFVVMASGDAGLAEKVAATIECA